MTREEAIELLSKYKQESEEDYWVKRAEALGMAIEALQTEQLKESQENFNKDSETESMLNADLISRQAESCEDAIRRQAAIDELVRWGAIPEYNEAEKNILACCIGMLSTLPSVQPTQKIGKWVGIDEYPYEDWECNCCGMVVITGCSDVNPYDEYKYCPNCGTKMEEGD